MTPDATGQTAIRPLRILLIEDSVDIVRMMKLLLERDGHTIDVAYSIDEGKKKCKEGKYDLLISDLQLPDGFSYDLIEDGKACHGIKAIVVSGHALDNHFDRLSAAGMRAHLLKPFRIEHLRSAVQAVAG